MWVTRRRLIEQIGGATVITGLTSSGKAEPKIRNTHRELLTDDRIYYFRTDGDDGNDGLTNNAGGAFATATRAFEVVGGLDLNGYNVNIQAGAPGVFAPVDVSRFPIGSGTVTLVGDINSPAAYILSATTPDASAFRTRNLVCSAAIVVRGFKIESAHKHGIHFGHAGFGDWGWCDLGHCPVGYQVLTDQPLLWVTSSGPYWISGDAESHIYADLGTIYPKNLCTFLADVKIKSFLRIGFNAYLVGKHATYDMNGFTCTGSKFRVQTGGVLDAEDLSLDYFPGTVPGTVRYGGEFLGRPSDGHYGGLFQFSTGDVNILSGTARWLGLSGVPCISRGVMRVPMPFRCILKNLAIQAGAPAGAGQNFRYTLQKNGENTDLVLVVENVAAARNDLNKVLCQPGDYIEMKLRPRRAPRPPIIS